MPSKTNVSSWCSCGVGASYLKGDFCHTLLVITVILAKLVPIATLIIILFLPQMNVNVLTLADKSHTFINISPGQICAILDSQVGKRELLGAPVALDPTLTAINERRAATPSPTDALGVLLPALHSATPTGTASINKAETDTVSTTKSCKNFWPFRLTSTLSFLQLTDKSFLDVAQKRLGVLAAAMIPFLFYAVPTLICAFLVIYHYRKVAKHYTDFLKELKTADQLAAQNGQAKTSQGFQVPHHGIWCVPNLPLPKTIFGLMIYEILSLVIVLPIYFAPMAEIHKALPGSQYNMSVIVPVLLICSLMGIALNFAAGFFELHHYNTAAAHEKANFGASRQY